MTLTPKARQDQAKIKEKDLDESMARAEINRLY